MTVEKSTGLLFNAECGNKLTIPFIIGTEPNELSECAPEIYYENLNNNGSSAWSDQSNNNAIYVPPANTVPTKKRNSGSQTDRMNNSGNTVKRNNNSINWSNGQEAQENTRPIWEGISQ